MHGRSQDALSRQYSPHLARFNVFSNQATIGSAGNAGRRTSNFRSQKYELAKDGRVARNKARLAELDLCNLALIFQEKHLLHSAAQEKSTKNKGSCTD